MMSIWGLGNFFPNRAILTIFCVNMLGPQAY